MENKVIENSELHSESDPPSKRQKTDPDCNLSLPVEDTNGNYKISQEHEVSARGDVSVNSLKFQSGVNHEITSTESMNFTENNTASISHSHYSEVVDLNGTSTEEAAKELPNASSTFVDTTADSSHLISEAFSVISPAISPDNRFFPESDIKQGTSLYNPNHVNENTSLINLLENDQKGANIVSDARNLDTSKLDLLKILSQNSDQIANQDNYHERDYCTLIPFQFIRNHTIPHSLNAKYCYNCRCFLCDKNASECLLWTANFGAHCNATSRDAYWRQKRTIYTTYGRPTVQEHDIYKSDLLNHLSENQINEAMREAEIFFISAEQNINNAYRLYNSQPSNARRKSARQSRQLCTCKNKESQESNSSNKKGQQDNSKETRSNDKSHKGDANSSSKSDEKAKLNAEVCLKCKEDSENDDAGKRRRSYSDVVSKFEPVLTKAEAMLESENQASAAFVLVSESIRVLQNHDPSIFDNGKWSMIRKTILIRLEKLMIRIFIQEEVHNNWIQNAGIKCINDFTSACSEFNFTLFCHLASWKHPAIQAWISGEDFQDDIIEENFFVVKERKRRLNDVAKTNYCRLVKVKPSFPGIQFYIKQNRCADAVTAFYQMSEKSVQSLDEDRMAKIFVHPSSSNMQKALFQILLRYISLKILPVHNSGYPQDDSAKLLTYFINSPLFSSIIEILFKALNEFQIHIPIEEMFDEINRLIRDSRQVPCVQLKLPENVGFMTLFTTLILRVVLHSPETENIGLPKILERFMESKCQEPMVYLFGRASAMSKPTLEAFGRWLVQIYIPRYGVTNLDLHAMQRFSLNAVAVDLERLGVIVDVMGALQAHAQDEKNDMQSRASAEAILHQHGLRLMESLMGCPERNHHADKLSDLLLQVAGLENNQYNPLKHELSLAVCRYKLCRTGDERWLKRILELMPERSKEEVNMEMIDCVASKINSAKSFITMLPFLVKRGGIKKVGDLIKKCAYADETMETKMLHPEFINDIAKLLSSKTITAAQKRQLVEAIKDHVCAHVQDYFRYAVEKEGNMEQQRILIRAMSEAHTPCTMELCLEVWSDLESYLESVLVFPGLANAFVEWLLVAKAVFEKSGKLYDFGEKIKKINKGKLGKKINVRKALSETIRNLLADIPSSPTSSKASEVTAPVSKAANPTTKADTTSTTPPSGPSITAHLPNGQTVNILLSNLAPYLMQSTAQQSPVFTFLMPNGNQQTPGTPAITHPSSANTTPFPPINSNPSEGNNPAVISNITAPAGSSQYPQTAGSLNSSQLNNSMEEISNQHASSLPGSDMSTPMRTNLPNLSNAFMHPFYSPSHYMNVGMSGPPSTVAGSHANSSSSFSHMFNSFMPGQTHQPMNPSMQMPQSHPLYQHSSWQMHPQYGQQAFGPNSMSNHGYMPLPNATSTTCASELPQMEGNNPPDHQVSASPIEIDQYPIVTNSNNYSNNNYCMVNASENE